jgi:hypothetical protein
MLRHHNPERSMMCGKYKSTDLQDYLPPEAMTIVSRRA